MSATGMPALPPLNLNASSGADGQIKTNKTFNFAPAPKPDHVKTAALFGGFAVMAFILYKAVK